MKMKQEHYNTIKGNIAETLRRNDYTMQTVITHYKNNKIGHDHVKRALWDMLHVTMINGKKSYEYITEVLYKYLTDEHIHTALKQVMRDLT